MDVIVYNGLSFFDIMFAVAFGVVLGMGMVGIAMWLFMRYGDDT